MEPNAECPHPTPSALPTSKANIWPSSTPIPAIAGRAPAEAGVQRFFAVTVPSVHQMILTLERANLIKRTPGLARSIELLIPAESLPALRRAQLVKITVQRH